MDREEIDEQIVACTNCMRIMSEDKLLEIDDIEICPHCKSAGTILDLDGDNIGPFIKFLEDQNIIKDKTIKKLEKENKDLLEIIQSQQQEIDDLKAKLMKQIIKTAKSTVEIERLRGDLDNLKCCGNCSNCQDSSDGYICNIGSIEDLIVTDCCKNWIKG